MEQTGASVTALGAALMRAVHTRLARSPLIDDPWGDRLVNDAERRIVLNVVLDALGAKDRERCEAHVTERDVLDAALQAHPGYGWAVLRTRYAEDALELAVSRGVRQYVIVGAGFDSFSLRRPHFALDLAIYEIDHPATQALKRQRLREHGVRVPSTLQFIPADLGEEKIEEVLAGSPFRPTEPAFFSWLGVTQYLSREANLTTLHGIARASAPGTELVFTYVDHSALNGSAPSSAIGRLQETFAAATEPWVSGFDPLRLADDLRAIGLNVVEDLDGLAAQMRYCGGEREDVVPVVASHIVRAIVSEKSYHAVDTQWDVRRQIEA